MYAMVAPTCDQVSDQSSNLECLSKHQSRFKRIFSNIHMTGSTVTVVEISKPLYLHRLVFGTIADAGIHQNQVICKSGLPFRRRMILTPEGEGLAGDFSFLICSVCWSSWYNLFSSSFLLATSINRSSSFLGCCSNQPSPVFSNTCKTGHRPRGSYWAIAFPQSTGHNGIYVNERKEMKVNQVVDDTYCKGGWFNFTTHVSRLRANYSICRV